MDLKLLSSIDDGLDSSEVAALCFLCLDVVKRKSLEKVSIGFTVTVSNMSENRVLVKIENYPFYIIKIFK